MQKMELNEKNGSNDFGANLYAIDNLDLVTYKMLLEMMEKRTKIRERVVVRYKEKIVLFSLNEIALFYVEYDVTYLVTHEGKSYVIQKSLEEIERISAPCFFRVNRQFVINKTAIRDLSATLTRALNVNLKFSFPITISVSKAKSPSFMDWLIEAPEPFIDNY